MADLLLWFFFIELFGVLAFPVVFRLLGSLPDRGATLAKPLGLVLVGYALWLGSTLRLIPNERGSLILLLWCLGLLSLWLVKRHQEASFLDFVKGEWRHLLATETLFLGAFLFWAWFRSFDPSITGTEKPMDFAFLNASLRSEYFPPVDPWLSGYTVSYYYFGHLLTAMVVKLSGIVPGTAFNLSIASLFALTLVGSFGLVFNLVRLAGSTKPVAGLFGLTGAAITTLSGNLEGLLELAYSKGLGSSQLWSWLSIKDLTQPYVTNLWYPTQNWWWWRGTRVIDELVGGRSTDYTITEFPFFSFLLADLHPHVMALPFVLLALGLALNQFLSDEQFGWSWLRRYPWHWLAIVVCLGALGFINSWDLPTYTGIFLLASVLRAYQLRSSSSTSSWLDLLVGSFITGIAALLLYAPFYLTLQSQASGILPWTGPGSRPIHYLLIWAPLLTLVAGFLTALLFREVRGWPLRLGALVVLVLPLLLWLSIEAKIATEGPQSVAALRFVGQRIWFVAPLSVVALLALRLLPYREPDSALKRPTLFVLLLVFVAFSLQMATESVAIQDVFNNRMNTVFKFYYQAWLLFAPAATFGLYYIVTTFRTAPLAGQVVRLAWAGAAFFLVLGTFYYSAAAFYSKSLALGRPPNLNGLSYLQQLAPAELEAIQWMQKRAQENAIILEATGPEYSDFGRVSAATGLPTLLGWVGHERQWGRTDREYGGRAQAIETIYSTTNPAEALQLLQRYGVHYVFVGRLERARYPREALDKFTSLGRPVFEKENVVIYKVG